MPSFSFSYKFYFGQQSRATKKNDRMAMAVVFLQYRQSYRKPDPASYTYLK